MACITGLGLVSPLGCSVPSAWDRILCADTSAFSVVQVPVVGSATSEILAPRVVAKVPTSGPHSFVATQWMSERDADHTPLYVQYALCAALSAIADARLVDRLTPARTAVAVGTGIGGLAEMMRGHHTLMTRGHRRVSPRFIPSVLPNMAAGAVSLRLGARGPCLAPATACAAGADALAVGLSLIRSGAAVVVVAGGTEACINELAITGFSQAKALSSAFVSCPSQASRPFDRARDGFVLAEGAAVLVLESEAHAQTRQARVYARLLGAGQSADAFHVTAPLPDGASACAAMQRACIDGRREPGDILYINAHATSTPVGDAAELNAIASLFGSAARQQQRRLVSSTKGATGHMLGAAGAAEAMWTALALHENRLPPTANLSQLDDAGTVESPWQLTSVAPHRRGLQLIDGVAGVAPDRSGCALSNSFGFGGTNVSLLFEK